MGSSKMGQAVSNCFSCVSDCYYTNCVQQSQLGNEQRRLSTRTTSTKSSGLDSDLSINGELRRSTRTRQSKSWGEPTNGTPPRISQAKRRQSMPGTAHEKRKSTRRSTNALDPTMDEQLITISTKFRRKSINNQSRSSKASVSFDVEKTIEELNEQIRKLDDEYT